MTIIHPKKENRKTKLYITTLIFSAIIVAVSGVFIYNLSVNYKHEIAKQKSQLREVEVKNAELKTEVFALSDIHNMEITAKEAGFVLDKNPQFIKIPQLANNR